MTRLFLNCAIAITLVTQCASVFGQAIRIQVTDKEGTPRKQLNIRYAISGIDVERDSAPISIIRDEPATTDDAGVIEINVQRLRNLIAQYSESLAGSEQIRIELYPRSDDEKLSATQLDFLLGTEPQDLKIVIMKTPFAEAAAPEVASAVYRGRRGTFHLLDGIGTAFYCEPGGSFSLTQLEYSSDDDNFVYYREMGSGKKWAFARRCRSLCAVWLCDPSKSNKWQRFEVSRRIEVSD